MKALLALILAAAASLPCRAVVLPEDRPSPQAQSGGYEQLVARYMAAWNAHDSSKAAQFLDEGVEYFDASTPEPQKGREQARKNVIQGFITAAPDLEWSIEPGTLILGGNGIAFQWRFKGTNTGPWPDGTAATGKKFAFRGASLIRFKGTKIAFQGDFYDAYGFFKQLGLAQ